MSMTANRRSTVVGVFEDRERAREAIEALKDAGFPGNSISILSPDKDATQDIAEETGTHAGSGAATGALAGGVLGGLGGWLVGIGALAIPGIGPFIAAGAFATALSGAAVGASLGAIAGALAGMGVPNEDAQYYEDEAKAGRTLVTVQFDRRYDEAQRILREYGAYDVESRHPGTAAAGAAPVTVERTPVERRPSDRPMDDRGQSIPMSIRDEQVEVERRPVTVGGATWDQARPRYQQRWQERNGTSGERWEDAEPGYRYGYEMRERPEYRGRTWSDVEPEFERDWTRRNQNTPWERAKESIRDSWEGMTDH